MWLGGTSKALLHCTGRGLYPVVTSRRCSIRSTSAHPSSGVVPSHSNPVVTTIRPTAFNRWHLWVSSQPIGFHFPPGSPCCTEFSFNLCFSCAMYSSSVVSSRLLYVSCHDKCLQLFQSTTARIPKPPKRHGASTSCWAFLLTQLPGSREWS